MGMLSGFGNFRCWLEAPSAVSQLSQWLTATNYDIWILNPTKPFRFNVLETQSPSKHEADILASIFV
jgi:hypothetical protein